MNWESLVPPNIAAMRGYESARSLCQSGDVFLDANESGDDANGLNRYPSPQPKALLQKLAQFYGVDTDQIFMGRGIDEAIDLLVRTFCQPGHDAVMTCPPTYGMYKVATEMQGAVQAIIPLVLQARRFELDLPNIELRLAKSDVKIIFLCRPNNPTGDIISLAHVERLASLGASKTIVAIDEAYIEFAETPSAVCLLAKYPNIVVLRTFSKAWALAGARFGVAIGNQGLINMLKKTSAPYPISTPVIDAITRNLTDAGISQLKMRVKLCLEQKAELAKIVLAFPSVAEVYPSHANFLLVRFESDSASLSQYLKQRGIVIRDRSSDTRLQNCLRISIGNKLEIARLLTAWSQWEQERRA